MRFNRIERHHMRQDIRLAIQASRLVSQFEIDEDKPNNGLKIKWFLLIFNEFKGRYIRLEAYIKLLSFADW